ncbi:hypothetical protein [Candidatus Njordibacter sp. Uisw_002]|uniref:hypothetical protein n=1 Tax=Candidatus Njordibacter sp. Uisw_002 TaxID=3230971 RepID=UPI003D3EA75B
MNNMLKTFSTSILALWLVGCGGVVLQPVSSSQSESIANYRFIVIPIEKSILSGSGYVTKEFSPDDWIEDILLKRGLIRASEVPDGQADKTLILRYANSGTRDVYMGLGYTMEVSISILESSTLRPVYNCTAEGIGDTEVDDLRDAISRCLSDLVVAK